MLVKDIFSEFLIILYLHIHIGLQYDVCSDSSDTKCFKSCQYINIYVYKYIIHIFLIYKIILDV